MKKFYSGVFVVYEGEEIQGTTHGAFWSSDPLDEADAADYILNYKTKKSDRTKVKILDFHSISKDLFDQLSKVYNLISKDQRIRTPKKW